MPVLSHLRVSIENTTTKYKEFDDTRSLGRSTVNCVQTCLGVEHNQQFSIVLRPLPGFTWNGANGFIVTIDFDEGTQINRYEVVLVKKSIRRPSRRSMGESTVLSTGTIDSLVLPKVDIHQRFRFRFIEMRDERNQEYHDDTKTTPWDHQGTIRIEVRRVKIEARRNSTTPDFGQPKKTKRAPKALLRKQNITHEIDLIPMEELYDYGHMPFRSTSVNQAQVGIFIFRYSGVGTLENVEDEDNDTHSELEEPSAAERLYILLDAHMVYGSRDDGMTASGQNNKITEPDTQEKGGKQADTVANPEGMHTEVAQDRAGGLQDVEAAQVPKLASGDLIGFDECGVEKLAQLNALDKELDALEAHIAALKRQHEEREQKAANVLEKRNELYDMVAKRQSQSVANLQADIDDDQRKVDSKKRKLDQMIETQAQLRAEKRTRDTPRG